MGPKSPRVFSSLTNTPLVRYGQSFGHSAVLHLFKLRYQGWKKWLPMEKDRPHKLGGRQMIKPGRFSVRDLNRVVVPLATWEIVYKGN